ncbi:PKD1L3 [Branchiostoma lanceolatum]|uniref:PKD1L3 protein n=1 Tax=Branchiostoma lanceolatum TaxID=7740 RepID=A0A8J9ZW77_BRALA|nr:PKD1L3 [Branchiostoma lanceolatum]
MNIILKGQTSSQATQASHLRECVRNCGSLVDEAAVFGIQAVCNDCRDPNRELTFVWHMFEIDLRTDTTREISDLSSMQVPGLDPYSLGIMAGNLQAGKRYRWIVDAVPNDRRPAASFEYEAATAYKYNMSCTAAPTIGFSGQTSFTITASVDVEPRSEYQVNLQAHPVTYTVTTEILTIVQNSRLNSIETASILAGSSADSFVVPVNVLAVGDDESVALCSVDVTVLPPDKPIGLWQKVLASSNQLETSLSNRDYSSALALLTDIAEDLEYIFVSGADMATALIQQGFGALLQRARSAVGSSSTPPPYRSSSRNVFDKDWNSASTTDELLRLLSLPTGDELELQKFVRSTHIELLSGHMSSLTSLNQIEQASEALMTLFGTGELVNTGTEVLLVEAMYNAGLALYNITLFGREPIDRDVLLSVSTVIHEGLGSALDSALSQSPTKTTWSPQTYGAAEQTKEGRAQDSTRWGKALQHQGKGGHRIVQDEGPSAPREVMAQAVMGYFFATTEISLRTLLHNTTTSSPPAVIRSAAATVIYQRHATDRVQEGEFSRQRSEGFVTVPEPDIVFQSSGNNADVVDSRFMAFSRNPFIWDNDTDTRSSVVSLDFYDDSGQPLPVEDTQEPLQFFVQNYDTPGTPEVVFMNDSVVASNGLSYHRMDVGNRSMSTAIVVMVLPPPHVIGYQVYMQYNEPPTPDRYNFTTTIPPLQTACRVRLSGLSGVDVTATFPRAYPEVNGTYYIGVEELDPTECKNVPGASYADVTARLRAARRNETYKLAILTPRCNWWNVVGNKWNPSGCTVGPNTTAAHTQCLTTHLTSFGADFIVPPNTIDFSTVFAKFANLSDNAAVFSTVIVMFGVYFIIVFFAMKADKRDVVKVHIILPQWGVLPIADNSRCDAHFYLITVYTGMKAGSGTSSRVGIILHGENGDSGPRPLAACQQQVFKRGSVTTFLLSTPESLGDLTNIHVWHDSSGEGGGASWFLDRLVVEDLQSNVRYVFFCQRWLAVEMEDGKVDRFLSAAGRDELTNFSSVFQTKTRQDISDGHLWFSVASRPTRSHFSRVQRASCCLSLVFLTMIANAMFFRTDDSVKQQVYRLGPLVFTPSKLWISFASTLIVFPVNFIIVYVFRKSRPKPRTKSSSRTEDLYEVQRSRPQEEQQSGLPHWCVYIGWVLVFLSATGSAFFVILYSMEWGAEKSGEWLTSILFSIFQSVLVIQPIKVIIFAVIIALTFKKFGKEEDTLTSGGLADDEEFLPPAADAKYVKAPKMPNSSASSREADLAAARSRRLKELRMNTILWDVTKHFLVVAVVFYLAFSSVPMHGYFMHKALKNTFSPIKMVKSVDGVWRWANTELLKVLFAQPASSILDDQSYRVGAAAFKQFRSRPGACISNTMALPVCKLDYSLTQYENGDFGVGWQPLLDTNVTNIPLGRSHSRREVLRFLANVTSRRRPYGKLGDVVDFTSRWNDYYETWKNDSTFAASMASAWVFTPGASFRYSGQVDTYTDGAYMFEIGNDPRQAVITMKHLQENGWLDDFTKAIIVEINAYNANADLFAVVDLQVEFQAGRTAVTTKDIHIFKLYSYLGTAGQLTIAFQIIFAILFALSLFREGKKLVKQKRKYFSQPWNTLEFLRLLLCIVAIVMFAVKEGVRNHHVDTLKSLQGGYHSFRSIAVYSDVFASFLAILVFVMTLQFLQLLGFNRLIGALFHTLSSAGRKIAMFALLIFILITAYSTAGALLFGRWNRDYSSFPSAVRSQLLMIFETVSYHRIILSHPVVGRMFFFSYVVIAMIIVLNVFVSILDDELRTSKRDPCGLGGDTDMGEFMIDRFLQFLGVETRQRATKVDDKTHTDYIDAQLKELEEKLDLVLQKADSI